MVVLAASPAEARRGGGAVVINLCDDIVHVRGLSAGTADTIGFDSLGYKYARFGILWLDLWRWDGEHVVYSDGGYAPISAEHLAALGGAGVPWKYHFPPGLVLLLAALEFWIITKQRRRVKAVLWIGGALILFSLLLLWQGVDKTFAIPGLLGLHHVVTAWFGMRAHADEIVGEVTAGEANEDHAAEPRPSAAVAARSSGATVARPSAAPPLPTSAASGTSQPLAIHRPQTAPADVPIVHDASAEGPKLLR
jgi:hypothetical protein